MQYRATGGAIFDVSCSNPEQCGTCASTRTYTDEFTLQTDGASGDISIVVGFARGLGVVHITTPVVLTPSGLAPIPVPTTDPTAVPTDPTAVPTAPPTGENAPDATPGPTSASTAQPQEFCEIFALSRDMELCWMLDEENDRLRIRMSYPQANKYLGWAIPRSGHNMNDADGVIGTSDGVRRYIFDGHSIGDDLEAYQAILDEESYESSNGRSTVSFYRDLSGAGDGQDVDASENVKMIIATGSTSNGRPSQHARQNRLGITVNLLTGESSVEDDMEVWFIAHGVSLMLGWLLFAPLAVTSAVLWKLERFGEPAWWFLCHKISAALCATCTLAGFFTIIYATKSGEEDEEEEGEEEEEDEELESAEKTHRKLGWTVFAVVIVHVGFAICRPGKPTKGDAPTMLRQIFVAAHQTAGYLLPVLAASNIAIGVGFLYPNSQTGVGVLVGLLCAFVFMRVVQKLYGILSPMLGYNLVSSRPKKGLSGMSGGEDETDSEVSISFGGDGGEYGPTSMEEEGKQLQGKAGLELSNRGWRRDNGLAGQVDLGDSSDDEDDDDDIDL